MKFVALVVLFALNLLGSDKSHAFFVSEVEPGIVELKGALDGSLAAYKTHIDKKRRWIYLEIKEGKDSRFFYASYKDFTKLNQNKKLKSLQYGIGNRIQNSKGKIPFGAQRYFYPIVDYKSASDV